MVKSQRTLDELFGNMRKSHIERELKKRSTARQVRAINMVMESLARIQRGERVRQLTQAIAASNRNVTVRVPGRYEITNAVGQTTERYSDELTKTARCTESQIPETIARIHREQEEWIREDGDGYTANPTDTVRIIADPIITRVSLRHPRIKTRDLKLRGVSVYEHISGCFQNNDVERCVDDAIIARYPNRKPRLTRERFDTMFGDGSDGRTIDQIVHMFKTLNIPLTMYAPNKRLFVNQTGTDRRQRRMIAFAKNGHMYIVDKQYAKNQKIDRVLSVKNVPDMTADKIIDTRDLLEHLITISRGNMSGVPQQLPEFVQNRKGCITFIRFKRENGEIDHMFSNPMHGLVSAHEVVDACDDLGIGRTHQSLTTAICKQTKLDKTLYQSSYNEDMKTAMCNMGALVFTSDTLTNKQPAVDINRCRANILTQYQHPVFKHTDCITKFTGEVVDNAFYKIEIDAPTLVFWHGSCTYNSDLIKLGLEIGEITLANIKYQMVASGKTPVGCFNKFVEYCKDSWCAKLVPNAFIGTCALNTKQNSEITLTSNAECATWFAWEHDDENVNALKTNTGDDIYIVYRDLPKRNMHNAQPIYNNIVNIEHMLVVRAILACGLLSDVQYIKTDAISLNCDTSPALALTWPNGLPMFKTEPYSPPKCANSFVKHDHKKYTKRVWNVVGEDVEISQITTNGGLIHAPAGTGKTWMLKACIEALDASAKIAVFAPTHCAKRNLQKMLSDDVCVRVCASATAITSGRIKKFTHIFVDEVSMCTSEFMEYLTTQKQHGAVIVLSGDYKQLPCIDDGIRHENHCVLHELCNGLRIELTTIKRTDNTDLITMCHALRNGALVSVSHMPNKVCDRAICFTNIKRFAVNAEITDRIHAGAEFITCETKDHTWRLCVGMLCIGIDNVKKINNGFYYTVVSISKTTVVVEGEDGAHINIQRQYVGDLINCGYCITIHKSQGQSFDFEYSIYEWTTYPRAMRNALRYVALSRARNLDLINIP